MPGFLPHATAYLQSSGQMTALLHRLPERTRDHGSKNNVRSTGQTARRPQTIVVTEPEMYGNRAGSPYHLRPLFLPMLLDLNDACLASSYGFNARQYVLLLMAGTSLKCLRHAGVIACRARSTVPRKMCM